MPDALKGISWTTYFPLDDGKYILTKQKQDQKIKSYIPNLKAFQAPLIEN